MNTIDHKKNEIIDPRTHKQWFVLVCKKHKEFFVEDLLRSQGFTVYCPSYIKYSQWSDRVKKRKTPLIPPYVFVQIEESKRDTVFIHSFIKLYLFSNGKPAIVFQKEIDILKGIDMDAITDVHQYKIGDRVTINDPVFNRQNGLIQKVHKNKVTIELESLAYKLIINTNKLINSH